jgi:hypothetical protein
MDLVVRDPKTGKEVKAVIAIEDYNFYDDADYMRAYAVADEIDRAVAHLLAERMRMAGKFFKPGDRVMAYSNTGRMGKGTVIPSTDSRLSDYIKVRMDRNGLEVNFRADFCKRLVKKVRDDVHSDGDAE